MSNIYHDPGCYADGSLGHDHIRAKLAELIADHDIDKPDLIAELSGDMPDDASDELEAIDLMNDLVPNGSDCYWEMVDGDLMFWSGASEDF